MSEGAGAHYHLALLLNEELAYEESAKPVMGSKD